MDNYDPLFGYKMGKDKLSTHGFAAATLHASNEDILLM